MAFDTKTFRTRALTSVVFVVIMLAGLFWNGWSFIILLVLIHFGCWFEFIRLIKKIKPRTFGYIVPAGLLYISLPIALLMLCGFPDTHAILYGTSESAWHYSPLLPCGIIFFIWINDTMAYIVGSFIGKTPLSKISPKKTWEGTIAGIILCILAGGFVIGPLLTHFFPQNEAGISFNWFVIAGITGVFSTLGDLLESKLKRMAQVKDSGSLMPGHGGFLDRFDSLLVVSLFVGLYYIFYIY
ncbi:MAG: phosphatidate cytidylyltransferase [Ginsengibacter sp.]